MVFEDGDEIIELGDNETTGMFDGCRLNSVYIGRNIDYRVPPFHNFKYLKTITIGSPITSLPGSFFYGSAIEKFITYSLNIDGLEYCSLDPSISAVVKTHTNFTGISSSNLTWFKNLTFEVDGENYGLVKGDDCLKFDNSIFSEADIDILPLQNCRAHMSDENSNKKVFFRGRDISVQLLSPQGFEFMPDSVHAKNVFTVYSDENPSTSRRVDLSEPGTLFDEIGLQNIEKIEMLTLSGNINGTDILTINRMTALKYLDMYDANIVEGGMTYRDNYMTKKDVIGSYFFNDVNLEVLRLPNTVNEINEYALSNEAYLKSLTIGSATTKIGKNAFEDCKSLTTITIPSSVKRIENNVFKNCTGLTELIMPYGPDALYLGDRIFSSTSWKEQFYDCPLETVYLGRDLSTSNTFANKKTLAKVTIADGVTSIVDGCFSDCTGLAEISLPNSIKKIGRSAFSKCSGLSIMDIPDSLETLGSRAFLGCTGIEKIVIPNSVTSIGEYCFSLCENLSDIEIASSVTEINDGAFNSCTGLKHIVFSDGPTPLRLGKTVNGKDWQSLFCDCPLETLYIGRVISSEYTPFKNITTLRKVSIGINVKSIPNDAFRGCVGLSEVNLPNSLKSIGESAFEGCKELVSIKLPESLLTMDNAVFYDCSALASIRIPESVKSMGNNTFSGCSSLTSVHLSAELTFIGEYTFSRCSSLSSISMPASVTSIGEGAFGSCSSLDSISIPASVTFIGDYTFYRCSSLSSISIPASVTDIGASAFEYCSSLGSISIPASVTSIGSSAFQSCTSLKEVTFLDGVEPLEVGYNVAVETCLFDDSPLTKVYLGRNIKSETSIHTSYDVATGKKHYYIDIYPPFMGNTSLATLTIGNSVKEIEQNSFKGCTGLTQVSLPNSVTSIGMSAFSQCSSLTEIIFPDSLERVDDCICNQCKSLASVTFGDNVAYIGDYAFCGTALQNISIPASVKSIGKKAFADNSKISKVYSLNSTPPSISGDTFDSLVTESATLYVQKGCLVYYWIDPEWKKFLNISDNLICLQVIPDAQYGDAEIDLTAFAPAGIDLVYETSNDDVVRILGDKMRIVGAGTATVGALLSDPSLDLVILTQTRQLNVSKAPLTLSVPEIVIEEGMPLPEFEFKANGLVYDDTLDDIDELPIARCEAIDTSVPGEYLITYEGGHDRNYELITLPSKVTVTRASSASITKENASDLEVEIFNSSGILIYRGKRSEAHLPKGIYIVRQDTATAKIVVR